jgi:high-affinity iron transporter
MLATAIIVFREVLEASLIVGIVLAATRGVPKRGFWVSAGIIGGVAGAILVALFAEAIANAAAGMGQELFNATILFAAVLMLGWHNVWMSREGRAMAKELGAVGAAVKAAERPINVLAIVVGIAVLREGSEIVLFLFGIAAAQGSSAPAMLAGGALGLALGAGAGAVLYFGLVRFAGKYLFSITSALVLLLASGMAALGARALSQAGYLPALGQPVWDSSALVPDQSALGNLLHALIGYTARPEGIQLVFFAVTFLTIAGLMYVFRVKRPRVPAAATLAAGVIIAVIGVGGISRVRAEDLNVYSPIVEPGEYAIETRGNVAFDKDPALDGAVTEVTEIEVTPNNWWHTALLGELVKEPPGSLQYTATGWENIFQLTPQGKYWADLALYLEYDWAKRSGEADAVEWKLLSEKSVGRLTFTLNPIWETEVGHDATGGTEFRYAARVKWRYLRQLEPAIELHGGIGKFSHPDEFRDQSHQIGPVLLGKVHLGGIAELKYQAGYLFGLTRDGSPDGAFKFLLEFERHF